MAVPHLPELGVLPDETHLRFLADATSFGMLSDAVFEPEPGGDTTTEVVARH